jgi:peptidyl-prolyl cis-trans isomerase C
VLRRSVLAAVLLASLACQRTPAASQTTGTAKPGTGQPAGQSKPAPGQPATTPAQPGQPGAPGAAEAPPPVKPVPAVLPEVVARIGTTDSISKVEFERAVRTIEANAGRSVPVEQRDQVYRRLLDQLIDVHLLEAEGKSRNIAVTDADVDTQIGQIKQKFKTEEEFTKALASRQMTVDDLKRETRKEMLVTKTLEAEILPKVAVQQSELDAYYQQNPDQFKQAEQVRASHILIPTNAQMTDAQKQEAKAQADGLLKRARAGEDFAALAKQYSKDSSASQGGDLNFFGKGQMVPAFDAAAFSLKPGDISDVVESQYGYHIIKVTEKKPERIVPLAEVSDKLGDFLKRRKQQEMASAFVQSLRGKYKVEILI